MSEIPDYLTSDLWLEQLFTSKEALNGGVVKRRIRDVERLVGRQAFTQALNRRGFQAVENGRHFVVFCNRMPIRLVR